MRFDLDEADALLKSSTRDLLDRESPMAVTRAVMDESVEGFSRDLYTKLAALGYVGLTLPESQGGSAAGAIGLTVVLNEMGRAALPGPYLDLMLAAEILRRTEGQVAAGALRRLLEGARIVLPARAETLAGTEPATLQTRFRSGKVCGTKRFIAFGASADSLLVTTADGLALVERPAGGWNAVRLETLDAAQRFVEIVFDASATLLADAACAASLLEEVDRVASLGAAALLLGLMERSLELAVAYLKERRAFGKPIGSFQALQHRAADMLLRTESSRSAVYRAAWTLENAPEKAPLLIAAAKAYCGESSRLVCAETIQMFGGVGFTWEYEPHIYFKRARTLEQLYGSTRSQLETALQAVGI